jgi:hypothetical protein
MIRLYIRISSFVKQKPIRAAICRNAAQKCERGILARIRRLKREKQNKKPIAFRVSANHNRHSMQTSRQITIIFLAKNAPRGYNKYDAWRRVSPICCRRGCAVGMGRFACDIPPCPAFYSVLFFPNPL